jgi:hypothetical protein
VVLILSSLFLVIEGSLLLSYSRVSVIAGRVRRKKRRGRERKRKKGERRRERGGRREEGGGRREEGGGRARKRGRGFGTPRKHTDSSRVSRKLSKRDNVFS